MYWGFDESLWVIWGVDGAVKTYKGTAGAILDFSEISMLDGV